MGLIGCGGMGRRHILGYLKLRMHYNDIELISVSPGFPYSNIKDLQRNFDGLGTYILSTSKGVLSDSEARVESVGGEILCKIF